MTLLTLREERCLFTSLLAELIHWIVTQGYQVALDEATVHSPRKVRKAGIMFLAEDAVHLSKSFHHTGLAADLLLYGDTDHDGQVDDWISDGNHPMWKRIAVKWENMHPLCTSGIRWNDTNHVSFGEGSKTPELKVS